MRLFVVELALIVLLISTSEDVAYVQGDIGTVTSYGPPYTHQFPLGNLFVAVSEGLWDNGPVCGKRNRLRWLSGSNKPCKEGTVHVAVIDYCAKSPCPSTILLSSDAFGVISKSPRAKLKRYDYYFE